MKCVMPGNNARVFARAVQSLSKIGQELYLEATNECFSMRTVNNTKSAFVVFKFSSDFFDDYNLDEQQDKNTENTHNTENADDGCKVSVTMKAYLGVFKNMKQVENCTIIIDMKNSKLVVQLKCRLETLKTHSLSIIDVQSLQAVYVTDNVPNKINASYRLFGEISNNFQMNEEEITIEASKDNLIVKNYIEGSHVDKRFMRSQLALKAEEFDKYCVKEETSITFCLREFRAILLFAEAINLDMLLQFQHTGQPVVFILNDRENLQIFEVTLVMSTVSPDDTICENVNSEDRSINETNCATPSTSLAAQKRSNTNRNEDVATILKKTRLNEEKNDRENQEEFSFRNDPSSSGNTIGQLRADKSKATALSSKIYNRTNHLSTTIEGDLQLQNENNDDDDCSSLSVTFKTIPSETNRNSPPKQIPNETNRNSPPKQIPNEDVVPKSPTTERWKQRKRTVFRRCFELTALLPGVENSALAPCSDHED